MLETDRQTPRLKPPWLKVRLGSGAAYQRTRDRLRRGALHTVCEEAQCPNQGLCWEQGRATLMILGDACTRSCAFCGVHTSHGAPPDADEPQQVAQAARDFGLNDVVITSVTRDDLPDGGAAHWAATLRAIRAACPEIVIEILIPDFLGRPLDLTTVAEATPDIWGHNIETTPALYREVRPQADYRRSLDVLAFGAARGFIVKTGLMLGLGETEADVLDTLRDARGAGVHILSLGQYLRPSETRAPVVRYVEPREFDAYERLGRVMGFEVVVAGPLVRSSFHSEAQDRFVRQRLGRGDLTPC